MLFSVMLEVRPHKLWVGTQERAMYSSSILISSCNDIVECLQMSSLLDRVFAPIDTLDRLFDTAADKTSTC